MYAVIAHSGKQYNVRPGLQFNVEKIAEAAGEFVTLGQVLLFDNNQSIQIGAPEVVGIFVLARVVEHGRGNKVRIIKLKRRKHHMKRQGHRQAFTRLEVIAIGDDKMIKSTFLEIKNSIATATKQEEKAAVQKLDESPGGVQKVIESGTAASKEEVDVASHTKRATVKTQAGKEG